MITTYTYFKNSNTSQLVKRQKFTETIITPTDYFYNVQGKCIAKNEYDLTGFVEVSEKKYNREKKKQLKMIAV